MSEGRGATGASEPVVFDRAADIYDETRGFPIGVAERVAALIAEAGDLGPGTRLLEVGVGTGRLALPLAARGVRVVGIDLSQRMMDRLLAKRGSLLVDVVRADAAHLPFAEGSFDAVLGVHVFHLIPRWREVLVEVARVLRPGAVLLLGGDDRAGEWPRWRDRVRQRYHLENVGVPQERHETFPEEMDWQLQKPAQRVEFPRTLHPRQLLERLARHDWSFTWRMSDAQLAEVVESLRADLVQRFGDLERRVEIETGFWVRAYRPPERRA